MNPAKPKKGAVLAAVETLPDPSARCLDFADGEARYSLILVRSQGRITAFKNRCPHARYSLEKLDGGVILQEGRFLVCAAHGASFRVADGAFCGGPGGGEGLTRLAVTLEGGRILMDE
jgi:nitrite reductase/ring-hydroxylating ferredoxin subunit